MSLKMKLKIDAKMLYHNDCEWNLRHDEIRFDKHIYIHRIIRFFFIVKKNTMIRDTKKSLYVTCYLS